MSIGEAVDTKLVDNETLGYFLVRIFTFMERIGMDMTKLRFRQHMQNEMAHYACDCWDCELLNSYGWTECVGCADRSAYDLEVHKQATGEPLVMRVPLKEPVEIEEWTVELDRRKSGPRFKKDAKAIEAALDELSQDLKEKLHLDLQSGKAEIAVPALEAGKVELDNEVISVQKVKTVKRVREIIPNVIEPSFGIGRILFSLMEHSFWTRPKAATTADTDPEKNVSALPDSPSNPHTRKADQSSQVLSFNPQVAPIKVLVCPLQRDPRFAPVVSALEKRLDDKHISFKVDMTGVSIGKRYSRNDELGIPFGITVDYETLEDDTVTLRDRDSTKQVRAKQEDIVRAISRMIKAKESWADVAARLPAFGAADAE